MTPKCIFSTVGVSKITGKLQEILVLHRSGNFFNQEWTVWEKALKDFGFSLGLLA